MLHELLHSFSVGGNVKSDFVNFPGWEEGVVEQMQRLLHVRVYKQIGINSYPGSWAYQRYINALEEVRTQLGREAEAFYKELLATPLKNRKQLILDYGIDNLEIESIIKKGILGS